MKKIRIKTRQAAFESTVVFPKNALGSELKKCLEGREALIFTDENVLRIWGKHIQKNLPQVPIFAMSAGEEYKTIKTLSALLSAMAEAGLHRNSVLVALGGGVVGDIGGLAASLYMRGIDCVQIPTTLLAQVDSSVGGKTAIDFCGVKNLVGAFKPPVRVIVDPAFLKTLPAREIRSGLGEIVKHGALSGEIFDLLSANRERLTDTDFLGEIVPENIRFKAEVVQKDPTEKGLRKCLNLGHTTAHAFELLGGALSHGEYVLVGTLFEAEIAKKHLACDEEYLNELKTLALDALGGMPLLPPVKEAVKYARLDKKNQSSDEITLTVPVRKGEYALLALSYEEYVRAAEEAEKKLC